MGNFMGYSSATELFTAIGNKIKAKQNAISDLETIRSGAAKGATAVQPATMTEALAAKQASLDQTQLAAVNSGITSEKVTQIETNKTNILYGLNTGVKNVLPYRTSPNSTADNGIAVSIDADNVYKITGTRTANDSYVELDDIDSSDLVGNHVASISVSGTGDCQIAAYGYNGSTWTLMLTTSTSQGFSVGSYTKIKFRIRFTGSLNSSYNATVKAMVCTLGAWNQSHDWQPPSLPNSDLTGLEAEDRAALAEEIDSGAKNLADIPTSQTIGSVTFTKDSNEWITSSSSTPDGRQWSDANKNVSYSVKAGRYIIYGETPNTNSGTVDAYVIVNGSLYQPLILMANSNGTVEVNLTSAGTIGLMYKPYSTNKVRYMITTKAAFGVSQKFVPYKQDPFYQVPINHNMIYRGKNLGATLTDAQHTALSGGNFTDLYLGDYWTKTVTIPAGTYTGGDGKEVTVPAQTNITLKAVIADFDTFYAGYASSYAGINTHHAAVIVTGFSDVVWNGTNSTAGGYVNSLIHKWLVGSVLPQIETWFGSAKVLSHQKLLTNAITGDAASGWAWSSQKISLLSENQMYGSKVWGNSKATNGGYEPGEAFKHLNVFNHIDANLLFGNRNIWLRDIASAEVSANLYYSGYASGNGASHSWLAPDALILLS